MSAKIILKTIIFSLLLCVITITVLCLTNTISFLVPALLLIILFFLLLELFEREAAREGKKA